ncbi:hypothetical protein GCM10025876_06650 [Demequina litorisediminis]|uniref:Uncharacterized protein n=1 Tax=Demequina litorisediminis TaxID=1849022 RepID=A0ABQ6IAH4_9MICO|nr:hypothetical protein GCM10025876_06650 [Demequina litorisediminis]
MWWTRLGSAAHVGERDLVLLDALKNAAAGAARDVPEAADHLDAALVGGRLLSHPRHEVVHVVRDAGEETIEDLLLGLEVVVQGGLRDPQVLGNLAQRGLVVAVGGEALESDLLDALARVSTPARRGLGHHGCLLRALVALSRKSR